MKKFILVLLCSLFFHSVYALEVVVTIKPLHSLVQSILGDNTQAKLLLDNSASPHDVQLKPSDIRTINGADVVFMMGRQFEGFMNSIIDSSPSDLIIVEFSEDDSLLQLSSRNHGHTDHADSSHDDHDPHLWLNPDNAKAMAHSITRVLSELDHANTADYQANLELTLDRLNQLDVTLNTQLSGLEKLAYMTQHDAYQYFESHYQLNFIQAISLNSRIPPSVKLALNIQKTIKSDDVRCIFREPQFSDRLVTTIAENAGISTGILDPIGIDLPAGPDLYFELMKNLGNNFADCFKQNS